MKLPPASHSMLQAFDNCPHKGYRMYIAKDLPREAKSKQQLAGTAVDEALGARIQRGRPLPEEYAKYERLVSPMVAHQPAVQIALAIRADGSACGFYDDDVFCRGYGDVAIVKPPAAVLFDWKNGKYREDKRELQLHGLMLQALHPTVTKITGYYVWLAKGDGELGHPHDVSATHETWAWLNERVDEIKFMVEQNNFPKIPNPLCGWCPVMDCEHNKVKQRLAKEANGG
jgi:CRISPR/Cas system-associated exonuclease Cas4 (RecB family)